MFTNRFRTATLALAGAALIATSLISSTALAAPAGSQPSPARAETVAAQPKIDVPRADASVVLSNIKLSGMPKYTVTVTNHGPERASVKVKVAAAYRDCNNCDRELDQVEETVTMNANTTREFQVECKSGQILLCESIFGQVKVTGVDSNVSNDVLFITH